MGQIFGDINQDDIVNSLDLSLLVSDWSATNSDADINNDGAVGSIDLSILVANWQKTNNDLPDAPAGLYASNNNEEIILHWDEVLEVESYSVYRSMNAGGPYALQEEGIINTSYTDTSTQTEITYYYTVRSVNDVGISSPSEELITSRVLLSDEIFVENQITDPVNFGFDSQSIAYYRSLGVIAGDEATLFSDFTLKEVWLEV